MSCEGFECKIKRINTDKNMVPNSATSCMLLKAMGSGVFGATATFVHRFGIRKRIRNKNKKNSSVTAAP